MTRVVPCLWAWDVRGHVARGFITNPGANRAKELELKDHDGSRPGLGVLATGRALFIENL